MQVARYSLPSTIHNRCNRLTRITSCMPAEFRTSVRVD